MQSLFGRMLVGAWLAAAAASAHASFLSGELLDTVADILAVVVLILVPVVAIVVFWMVHVLPEKFAHKRNHPQRDAIQVLCLLSLVFGGLLWPIAWLWAFTKPVLHRAAYGTDKHDDYYAEMAEKHRKGELTDAQTLQLKEELDAMESRGALTPQERSLKEELGRPVTAQAGTARAPAQEKAA